MLLETIVASLVVLIAGYVFIGGIAYCVVAAHTTKPFIAIGHSEYHKRLGKEGLSYFFKLREIVRRSFYYTIIGAVTAISAGLMWFYWIDPTASPFLTFCQLIAALGGSACILWILNAGKDTDTILKASIFCATLGAEIQSEIQAQLARDIADGKVKVVQNFDEFFELVNHIANDVKPPQNNSNKPTE